MMARPTAVSQLDTAAPVSYSGVAAALNRAFTWPAGKFIDRRQVERWHMRRTRNQLGQLPPSPLRKRRNEPRTAAKVIFDPVAWIEWARPGVPGPRNKGWVVPGISDE